MGRERERERKVEDIEGTEEDQLSMGRRVEEPAGLSDLCLLSAHGNTQQDFFIKGIQGSH